MKQNKNKAALHLIFINLPKEFNTSFEGFTVIPQIPIPVEPGIAPKFDVTKLTWEAIVAGMLRLLAWQPEHEHAQYYSSFVRAVKPKILTELSSAGIVKAKNREWDIAEEIFRSLQTLYPNAPEPLLDLAILYEEKSMLYTAMGQEMEHSSLINDAFNTYKKLLSFEPPFPPAIFNAAFFFMGQQNFARARELFVQFIKITDNAEAKAKAKEIVKKLDDQGYLDSLFKEAYDFIQLGKESEGLAKAQEFLARHPDIWNAHFLVGWAHRRLGNYSEAQAAFENALKFGGKETDIYNELAICLMELGEFKKAQKTLTLALHEEPENIKIISNLGVLAHKQGQDEEACSFFRTVLEIEPSDQTAQAWLKKLDI